VLSAAMFVVQEMRTEFVLIDPADTEVIATAPEAISAVGPLTVELPSATVDCGMTSNSRWFPASDP
jgi:hypothetical protein